MILQIGQTWVRNTYINTGSDWELQEGSGAVNLPELLVQRKEKNANWTDSEVYLIYPLGYGQSWTGASEPPPS